MIFLTIRTDQPEAEVGLFRDAERLAYDKWLAHRELSASIHKRISQMLELQKLELNDVGGLVVYTGPGSFTGLRIGISLANALSYSLEIPIAGVNGDDWITRGTQQILSGRHSSVRSIIPEYGQPAHTTDQKK